MTFFNRKSQRTFTCQIVQNTKRHLKRAKTMQISGIGHSVIRGLVTTGQWFSASTTVYPRGSPQGRRHKSTLYKRRGHFILSILKAMKSKRNNDVRTKLYPQSCGDFFGFAAADEPLLSQVAKHGDDAEIICVWIHSDSSFCDLSVVIMKTPKPTFTNGFGSFRYSVFMG